MNRGDEGTEAMTDYEGQRGRRLTGRGERIHYWSGALGNRALAPAIATATSKPIAPRIVFEGRMNMLTRNGQSLYHSARQSAEETEVTFDGPDGCHAPGGPFLSGFGTGLALQRLKLNFA
jgi:hypothetical protein